MAALATEAAAASMDASADAHVYTWGKAGVVSCLGHRKVDKEGVCPFPRRVRLPRGFGCPVEVAAGENASAAVSADGRVAVWGAGRGGRLGLGTTENVELPTMIPAFTGSAAGPSSSSSSSSNNNSGGSGETRSVSKISIGQSHMVAAVTVCGAGGAVERVAYAWGSGSHGALGRGSMTSSSEPVVVLVGPQAPLVGVVDVAAGYDASMALTEDGTVYTWGSGAHGKTGLGTTEDTMYATAVELPSGVCARYVAMGSLYAGAIDTDGVLYMWGFGKYGNLGIGTRKAKVTRPVRVECEARLARVAVTVGQINTKTGKRGSPVGQEGPHTLAVGEDGSLWAWGTCHKGMLGNLAHKTLSAPHDELVPYRVGDAARDDPSKGPTAYLADEEVVGAVSSSIHSAVVTASGHVYSFGCGSGGRMGVAKYMNGLHGGRSRMKCYISEPTLVEAFADRGIFVSGLDTSRRHMIAIGCREHAEAGEDSE